MKQFFSWSKFKESKTYILVLGIGATLWFLVRVIPKPSRASYPCMQAAAPLMSSFVIYLMAVGTSIFTFKKFKQSFRSSNYLAASLFFLATIVSFSFFLLNDNKEAIAYSFKTVDNTFPVESNEPIGTAIGLNPGRVVWVLDEDATDETFEPESGSGEFMYDYTEESVVMAMLEKSLLEYAGAEDINSAWDAIFKAYNSAHGRGVVGYTAGEKIAFKINLTNQGNPTEERADVTPQLLNAILHELTANAGVAQEDIFMGDPYREFRAEYIDIVMDEYPEVYYVDGAGAGDVNQTVPSDEAIMKFSDKDIESTLPSHYVEATYMINIACLKSHNEGGITLIAKNHQGSYLLSSEDPKSQYAVAMHYSLPANSSGAGNYRHTVDYMGHEQTGGKGLLYIVDGIWGGESWEGFIKKFKSEPFGDDYPNSLFISQDPVALESVCYDVLFEEYATDEDKEDYPIRYKEEIADYLKQMASSDYWPEDITYDPEGDGTPIGSLGVFEHWNNATDRQYSRNLGDGSGVELKYFKNGPTTGVGESQAIAIDAVYPNPMVGSATFVKPELLSDNAELRVYTISGQLITVLNFNGANELTWDGTNASNGYVDNGLYIYNIIDQNSAKVYTGKVTVRK